MAARFVRDITALMAKSIGEITKSRKRPDTTGTPVLVRLQADLLSKVDKAARSDGVTRPEAIRRMIKKVGE